MPSESLDAFYDKWAPTYFSDFYSPESMYRMFYDHIIKNDFVQNATSILDVGCGPGTIPRLMIEDLIWTKDFHPLYSGFDLSERMITGAQNTPGLSEFSCEFKVGNCLDRASYESVHTHDYQVILALGVLPHLNYAQIGDFLVIARSFLQNKGRLLMTFRNEIFHLVCKNLLTDNFLFTHLFEYQKMVSLATDYGTTPEALAKVRDSWSNFNEKLDEENRYGKTYTGYDSTSYFHSLSMILQLSIENNYILRDMLFLNQHPLPPNFKSTLPDHFWEVMSKYANLNPRDHRGLIRASSIAVVLERDDA